ncbi:MAG: hypothetical protein WDZ28_04215 [Simkaniaceae bacterium]
MKKTLLLTLLFLSFSSPNYSSVSPNLFEKSFQEKITEFTPLLLEKKINVSAVQTFLSTLCREGYAEVEGLDTECRSICVTAQGAIEEALAHLLKKGTIRKVDAIFLTPLPTTPLRKKGQTTGLSSETFDPARAYTLDMREVSLRVLRKAHATIHVAYSKDAFERLKSSESEDSLKQIKIWEKEKKHPYVMDAPLSVDIPSELVGALYLIEDSNKERFILTTHGIQAKDAPNGFAIWKKWFSPASEKGEGYHRALQMMNFIFENGAL